ncbi:MAG TPA: hypothetical protein VFQ59_02205 [Candidatus Paceibacterota bacterium]|nr:hypothetical protein [Candidatus Paceibacterota bacterium]
MVMEELSDLILLENFSNPVLVPIPLSRKRLRERGYNQCEILVKGILEVGGGGRFRGRLGKKVGGSFSGSFSGEHRTRFGEKYLEDGTGMLQKVVDNEHQARARNKSFRLRNIVGTFRAHRSVLGRSVAGRNVILIDDVTTTGATLEEARKTLLEAGALRTIAFTLAH